MTRRVWFLNPYLYIRQVVSVRHPLVAWDESVIDDTYVDPWEHTNFHLPRVIGWRLLVVGDETAIELGPHNNMENPKAVYPVWRYGLDRLDLLEELFEGNWTKGQERRVLIADHSVANWEDLMFLNRLGDLREEYPEVIIHAHDSASFTPFVEGVTDVSLDVCVNKAVPDLLIPGSGIRVPYREFMDGTAGGRRWIASFGFARQTMQDRVNRVLFNLMSARWTVESWDDRVHWRNIKESDLTKEDFRGIFEGKRPKPPEEVYEGAVPASIHSFFHRGEKSLGDKFNCNTCSARLKCRAFREGSVCSLTNKLDGLVDHFQTKSAGRIMEGLVKIIQDDIDRLMEGRSAETMAGTLDPHVTRLSDAVYRKGVQLAKLVDPNLNGAAVNVNVGTSGPTAIQIGRGAAEDLPHQIAARLVAQLESGGVPRQFIDETLILEAMQIADEPEKLDRMIAVHAARHALPSFIDTVEVERDGS